jgi:hypothetical protein
MVEKNLTVVPTEDGSVVVSQIGDIQIVKDLYTLRAELSQAVQSVQDFYALKEELSQAQPGDVQKIAASEIGLLRDYYQDALVHVKRSFIWALVAAVIGLFFFIGAIIFLLATQNRDVAIISVISGAIVEVISGVNFYLYGKTAEQIKYFHRPLEQTQRFLLANSVCESLDGEIKQKTRAQLVATIAEFDLESPKPSIAESK